MNVDSPLGACPGRHVEHTASGKQVDGERADGEHQGTIGHTQASSAGAQNVPSYTSESPAVNIETCGRVMTYIHEFNPADAMPISVVQQPRNNRALGSGAWIASSVGITSWPSNGAAGSAEQYLLARYGFSTVGVGRWMPGEPSAAGAVRADLVLLRVRPVISRSGPLPAISPPMVMVPCRSRPDAESGRGRWVTVRRILSAEKARVGGDHHQRPRMKRARAELSWNSGGWSNAWRPDDCRASALRHFQNRGCRRSRRRWHPGRAITATGSHK